VKPAQFVTAAPLPQQRERERDGEMAYTKDQHGDSVKKGGKSGNSRATSTTGEQRANRRRNRGNVEQATFKDVDPVRLLACVVAMSEHGAAIRLGLTRDGGAFNIGIYDGDDSTTEYVRPSEDINLYLQGLAEDFSN